MLPVYIIREVILRWRASKNNWCALYLLEAKTITGHGTVFFADDLEPLITLLFSVGMLFSSGDVLQRTLRKNIRFYSHSLFPSS